ncbi:BON domain-containing protein [Pseudomonas sp. HR96]|uniref:BON domain-containing protein n=1 Tax=Pseudomonas sp. HR96 TaxID=1027966 RepID=UPI002A7592BD|nr:BON domain-containing protein [Pseudomonas sp. HR96]WPO99834.1 BON domain-containing protein [Pseudomonas sp. HR96]
MPRLRKLALAGTTLALLGLAPIAAQAASGDIAGQLAAARQEGSIWTSFALNKHLSPFALSVKVNQGTAVLEGKVENEVDRQLAEQIALDTSGINKVDNRLTVDPALAEQAPARQPIAQKLEDATLTATIKSKLLWNSITQGLDISVDTVAGVVTLKGHAQTVDAKQLAGQLAKDTDGVYVVNNLISLGAPDSNTTRLEVDTRKTEDSLSDAWITSKVKASLVLDRHLDGLSIDVATKAGIVSLTGDVANADQKDMAVQMARNIRGVRGIDADLLKVAKPSAD